MEFGVDGNAAGGGHADADAGGDSAAQMEQQLEVGAVGDIADGGHAEAVGFGNRLGGEVAALDELRGMFAALMTETKAIRGQMATKQDVQEVKSNFVTLQAENAHFKNDVNREVEENKKAFTSLTKDVTKKIAAIELAMNSSALRDSVEKMVEDKMRQSGPRGMPGASAASGPGTSGSASSRGGKPKEEIDRTVVVHGFEKGTKNTMIKEGLNDILARYEIDPE